MPRHDLVLRVNGRDYEGWKSARVTRGIECVAGGFDLVVADKWNSTDLPWPIVEEDECEVILAGQTVVTGYVDRRRLSYGKDERSISVSGRDKTAALVDNSADLAQTEFLNVDILTLAHKLADPFDVAVTLQTPLARPAPIAKLTVDPGDTAWDALERACRIAGLLPVSDGRGGLVLSRAGTYRATTAIVRGENVLAASAEYDASARFHRYIAIGQRAGSDETYGALAAAVKGEARDEAVRRTGRVFVVRCEGSVTPAAAKTRAEWEAAVRAARGRSATYTVQGWTQRDGTLWPVNALVPVRDAWLGIEGDMLIAEARYVIGDEGRTTELYLRRPDAFTPQPVLTKASESAAWKELN